MTTICLEIDCRHVFGDELVDFPLLVDFQHPELQEVNVDTIGFTLDQDTTQLDHEVESFDPHEGHLRGWVRIPQLSGTSNTRLSLHVGTLDKKSEPGAVWRAESRLVVHGLHSPSIGDSSGKNTNLTKGSDELGNAWVHLPFSAPLELADTLTVEAVIDDPHPQGETLQVAVSQWKSTSDFGPFAAYDAGTTDGLDSTGFFGAVFDGRYVYFVPQHDLVTRHGKVLRYDTHQSFQKPESWEAYDAGHTDGLNTKGYYGAVYDGRYVFFVPRRDAEQFHSRVLRYDTNAGFKDPSSWQAYDAGLARSYQSAAFDGRYIYFTPGHTVVHRDEVELPPDCESPAVTGMDPNYFLLGSSLVLRHDTQGEFKDPASWVTHDVAGTGGLNVSDYDGAIFDGRYVYFCPLSTSAALRYDTQSPFDDQSSWSAIDVGPLDFKLCVGAVFDGQHVYFVPYGETKTAIRYDTSRPFTEIASWEAFDVTQTPDLHTWGFDGAFFDGRYIYYIPYYDGGDGFHGVLLRYDPGGSFTDPASWSFADGGLTDGLKTVSFNGGATDGRYLYCAAWMDGETQPERLCGNGRVLRYDTTGDDATFSLQSCSLGHNGGLCAALPGPRFLVNTTAGPVSASANCLPSPGRCYLAGVFDGQSVALYVNGQKVDEQQAAGRLVDSRTDVTLGRVLEGLGQCRAKIQEVRITAGVRNQNWIATTWENLSSPTAFCPVVNTSGA